MGKVIEGSKVLMMGLTYKENVADTRETPVKDIIRELKEYGVEIYGYDPLLDNIEHEFGIKPYDSRLVTSNSQLSCHCEERSDVAISTDSPLPGREVRLVLSKAKGTKVRVTQ